MRGVFSTSKLRLVPADDVDELAAVCLLIEANRSSGAATAFELAYGLLAQDNTDSCAYPPEEPKEHRGRPAFEMEREGERAPYEACDAVDGGTKEDPAKFVAPGSSRDKEID